MERLTSELEIGYGPSSTVTKTDNIQNCRTSVNVIFDLWFDDGENLTTTSQDLSMSIENVDAADYIVLENGTQDCYAPAGKLAYGTYSAVAALTATVGGGSPSYIIKGYGY